MSGIIGVMTLYPSACAAPRSVAYLAVANLAELSACARSSVPGPVAGAPRVSGLCAFACRFVDDRPHPPIEAAPIASAITTPSHRLLPRVIAILRGLECVRLTVADRRWTGRRTAPARRQETFDAAFDRPSLSCSRFVIGMCIAEDQEV